jgi:hypothetical protein
MAELDDETKNEPESPIKEKSIEQAALKAPTNKSLINLTQEASASDTGSETSSIAPDDDEGTLVASTLDLKKAPRKLIEDEKRSTGRISWDVWMTYFGVSHSVISRFGMLMVGTGREYLVYALFSSVVMISDK